MLMLVVKRVFFISMLYVTVLENYCGKGKKKDLTNKKKKVNDVSITSIIGDSFNDFSNSKSKLKKNTKHISKKIDSSKLRKYDILELRKNDKEYLKSKVKRDSRSLLDFSNSDLTSQVTIIRKEIVLSENDGILEKDGIIAEKLFEDVKNKNIKVYSDSNLQVELSYDDLLKRMIKPVNLESRKRRNEKRKFKYSDIDSILIEEHLFWVKNYPSHILDKMTVTLIIPQNRSGIIEDIVVCYIQYNDFIDFLNKNKIIINNKFMKTTFSDAINNNKLLSMYKSISNGDNDYTFNTESYDKNKYECENIISNIKMDHFSARKV